jgi:leucyl aminopeptidase (aminopeptidase T)
MSMSIVQMAPTARIIVEQALAIKRGEKVCIFTDTDRSQNITKILAAYVQAIGAESIIVTITPKEVGGVDPPAPATAAIQAADVIIAQASRGILHTETVRGALKRGARICDMWGFDEDMMVRGGATADYKEIDELSHRLAAALDAGKEARLTTPAGTDITMNIKGRGARVLAGMATKPGQFCAFPDGEAAISPLEGSARGVLVNPFCMEKEGLGFIKENLTMRIEKGQTVEITGGAVAAQLTQFVNQQGENARNIAELGLGTNSKARAGVTVRETKKSYGTAHVAIGDNMSIGGKVHCPFHMDSIVREPTLVVDGKVLIKDGKIII